MNRDDNKIGDPYIFLSMINMKLRDYYSSLEALCYQENLSKEIIEERMKSIGYEYCEDINQFKAEA